MTPEKKETITIRLHNEASKENKFYTYSRKTLFDGFRKIYRDYREENKNFEPNIANPKIGASYKVDNVEVKEHISEPPARFNQASLVKTLDESGVGRPSTYTTMAKKPLDENYATLISRAYHMTETGNNVVEQLVKFFPHVINTEFTKEMEERLDDIQADDQN
jgi:DNA topoisomerase-1